MKHPPSGTVLSTLHPLTQHAHACESGAAVFADGGAGAVEQCPGTLGDVMKPECESRQPGRRV